MFLDTSVIVEILSLPAGSRRSVELLHAIGNEPPVMSVIQLGELSDWCLRGNRDPSVLIRNIREVISLVPVTEGIVLEGSRLKMQRRTAGYGTFSLMDGIILASAMELGETLLTLDQDFPGLGSVVVWEP